MKKRINADIVIDSNVYTFTTGSFSVFFKFFRKSNFYDPLPINGIINRLKLNFKLQNSL